MSNKQYLLDNWQNRESLEQAPTRNGYGDGLVKVGEENPNVVVLCADLTESTRSLPFKEAFPERFIECGVSEQNMVTVASGLAAVGKIPFVSSYAMFCPGLTWVQARTTLSYNERKVIIGGAHSGVSVGPDGATHQALEDMAIMRVIPNMTVIAPADMNETYRAVLAAVQAETPVYLRFGREATPVFSREDADFAIGKAIVLREGTDVTIVGCGPVVYEALAAAEQLAKDGIQCEIINSHTVKPLDIETISASARKTGKVVTVEEHQITGGLGGAVAEALSEITPVPMKRIGVPDVFGQSGEATELLDYYGLTAEKIAETVGEFMTR